MINKQVQVVFLGAPGSGKGTQASVISKDLSIPHVDTGSMLRAAVAEGTDLGKLAKEKMDQGQLVPPDIVIGIIGERLSKSDCDKGFMLDGFPRNLVQAQGLDEILIKINKQLTHVLNIDVDENILTDRLVYRRSCEKCDTKYNLKFNAPKEDTKCDKCGGNLIQRSDDNLENTKRRFATYKEETEPLIAFYKNKGLLHDINGNKQLNDISKEIMDTLK